MLDKKEAFRLLARAAAGVNAASATIEEIKKEGGRVVGLGEKRKAARNALRGVEGELEALKALIADHTSELVPEPEPEPKPEPETADRFSIQDQHAVSKLMQDSAVHLAARRQPHHWEIRHRNTAGGDASEPIRADTIAEAYAMYERQAKRSANFVPFQPRALSQAEQQALDDLYNVRIDNPRSVRWEGAKTEVDYLSAERTHGSSRLDGVEFGPGELIGPIGHLKRHLG